MRIPQLFLIALLLGNSIYAVSQPKSISEMTIEEVRAELAEIFAQDSDIASEELQLKMVLTRILQGLKPSRQLVSARLTLSQPSVNAIFQILSSHIKNTQWLYESRTRDACISWNNSPYVGSARVDVAVLAWERAVTKPSIIQEAEDVHLILSKIQEVIDENEWIRFSGFIESEIELKHGILSPSQFGRRRLSDDSGDMLQVICR